MSDGMTNDELDDIFDEGDYDAILVGNSAICTSYLLDYPNWEEYPVSNYKSVFDILDVYDERKNGRSKMVTHEIITEWIWGVNYNYEIEE